MKHLSVFFLSHLSNEKFNSHLGLMEYHSFDLPVWLKPFWVDLTTVHLIYCSHVGHFFYFIWWLLKEPFVCVNEKIYSLYYPMRPMQYKLKILHIYLPFCFLPLAVHDNKHILFALAWFRIAHKCTKTCLVTDRSLLRFPFAILRIRNTFSLKTVRLKTSHYLEEQTRLPGLLCDVTSRLAA